MVMRDVAHRQTAWLACWAALSGAAYLLCSYVPVRTAVAPIMPFVEVFCQTGPIAIWLFSITQFRDRVSLWPTYILIALASFAIMRIYGEIFYEGESMAAFAFQVLNTGVRFCLIAHMVYVAWEGRGDDLVEVRRKFRTVYITAAISSTLAITFAESFFSHDVRTTPEMYLAQAVGFWLLTLFMMWYGAELKKNALFSSVQPAREPTLRADDPTERHDLDAIKALMDDKKLYLEAGLTINALAERAGLPEHRLRRLINQHMGYRNFADFLNHYRIKAAKNRLSDVSERNTPVLTIAMDLGYGSLGPFNRAFKERTSQTPTEYRKKRLADF